LKFRANRRRRAISEIMGALIMIAMTLVAGSAAFGWINGQAGASERQYGNSVAAGVNNLREHFTLVSTQFTGTGGGGSCSGVVPNRVCTGASLWLYNTGQVTLTLFSIQVQSPSSCSTNCLNIIYTSSGYTAYNGASVLVCPNTPGYSPSAQTIAIGTMGTASAATPFTITIPNCSGVNDLYVGQSYTITLTGVYQNTVAAQLTVSG